MHRTDGSHSASQNAKQRESFHSNLKPVREEPESSVTNQVEGSRDQQRRGRKRPEQPRSSSQNDLVGGLKNNYVSISKWEEALSNIQSQIEQDNYMTTQGSYFYN